MYIFKEGISLITISFFLLLFSGVACAKKVFLNTYKHRFSEDVVSNLYNLYKDVLKDRNSLPSRRFENDQQFFQHVNKLREVNGYKKHNLQIQRGAVPEKLIYISNPLESKIPHAFLSMTDFRNRLIEQAKALRGDDVQKPIYHLPTFAPITKKPTHFENKIFIYTSTILQKIKYLSKTTFGNGLNKAFDTMVTENTTETPNTTDKTTFSERSFRTITLKLSEAILPISSDFGVNVAKAQGEYDKKLRAQSQVVAPDPKIEVKPSDKKIEDSSTDPAQPIAVTASYYAPVVDNGGGEVVGEDVYGDEIPKIVGLPNVPDMPVETTASAVVETEIAAATEVTSELPIALPQEIPQEIPQEVPQEAPQKVPREVPQVVPQVVPQGVSQEVSQGVPQGGPQETPQGTPQGVPQEVPQGVPLGGPQEILQEVPPEVASELPSEIPLEVTPELTEVTDTTHYMPKRTTTASTFLAKENTVFETPQFLPQEIYLTNGQNEFPTRPDKTKIVLRTKMTSASTRRSTLGRPMVFMGGD